MTYYKVSAGTKKKKGMDLLNKKKTKYPIKPFINVLYIYIYIYIHTYIYIHIHTYIYIYTHQPPLGKKNRMGFMTILCLKPSVPASRGIRTDRDSRKQFDFSRGND